jgi:glycerol-3-phosphate dehydrogenase (NAD(P)+)
MSAARRVTVLGGGAWGTALALSALRAGHDVRLWARDAETVRAINQDRRNPQYLPDLVFDDGLEATGEIEGALKGASCVLAVVPAQSLRGVLVAARKALPEGADLVICAKGIEKDTGLLMSQMAGEVLPGQPIAALSGPSFAADVAHGLPTAVTVAAEDGERAFALASLLSGPHLRCYSTDDLAGVEAGGALKNVLAIAAGAVSGAGLGSSAQAAIITRGFVELRRLAAAFGGRPETLMGLSGLGDLILTCGSAQSRNFAYGAAIGAGDSIDGRPLAEGVATAGIAARIASQRGIEAPIISAVAAILAGDMDIRQAVGALMSRPLKSEHE